MRYGSGFGDLSAQRGPQLHIKWTLRRADFVVIAEYGAGVEENATMKRSLRPDVPSGDQADGRIGISPSPVELPHTGWGVVGVFGGGAVIAATLYAVHPDFGAGSLGRWRIAGIAIGLLMIAVGLVAVLHHGVLRTTNKAAVVAVTVIAVGAFAFGVEPIPTTVPDCSTVFGPTLENRGPLYCDEGNGTLVRKSISNVEECPNGTFRYTITVGKRGGKWPGDGWSVEWRTGNTCPLL